MYAAGLRRLLPRLIVRPGPAILDVGCGTGVNLTEAARWFAPTRLLAGIDLSPGMVEVARSKAAYLGMPAEFTVGDAEQLPYSDQLFDLVICNSVFHWFKDKETALSEMRRVLRPGGQLVLICASAPGFREWFGVLDSLMRSVLGPGTPRSAPDLPSAAEVGGLLRQSGFVISYMANPTSVYRVPHPESFIRLMSTVAPGWTADLPPESQSYIETMAAAYLRRNWPQGFPNTWSVFEAIGVRPD
ncbi:MAG TPA: methyltransferase domain-containing protein [Symbiobacteriaceae bacterium]|jgi:ubiquinone/menaquinone biosynthesis C-methylase UbiE